jgi:hypothetical protein
MRFSNWYNSFISFFTRLALAFALVFSGLKKIGKNQAQ